MFIAAVFHVADVLRQGTYQFMSVDLLSRPWKPVKIADELESFFHVLVYYSIRHLRSNCAHPSSYIDNYFNNYSGPGRLHTCGWKSLAIEVDDWLSTRFPHRPLLFRSPMDELLGDLLKSFHAHYKVMKDDMAKNGPPLPEPPAPPLEPSDEALAPVGKPDIVFFNEDGSASERPPNDSPDDYECGFDFEDVPTAEDRARAAQVADHAFMLEHVAKLVRGSDWPEDDRIPSSDSGSDSGSDADSATPTRSVGAEHERALHASNKRRRIAGPEPIVSLPARLRWSTRRTRMQPRTMPLRMR